MPFPTTAVTCRHPTPLGPVTLAATDRGLAGLWFDGQKHHPGDRDWPEAPGHPVLQAARTQLDDWFAGRRTAFDLPLDLAFGTPFQQRIWQALCAIPRGGRSTYGALGEAAGAPGSARAVGAAVGRNPVSIVVPCHRVLGSAGQLTGYAGGLDRKQSLLALEAAA